MSRVDQAGKYVLNRMSKELDGDLFYHNVPHVLDVLQAAEMIGKLERISDTDMELLKVAALFHDSGFLVSPENHEKYGCDIAMEYLPKIGFTEDEIEVICNLIMATKVPQSPRCHLEKIICDADLDYLGREDFFTTGNNIFREFQARNLVADMRDWNELQVKFLTAHNYFTATSIRLRSERKAEHLQKIKQLLQETV
jgi:uncharacterized protein